MAREKKETEFRAVTIRIPVDLYADYKEVLAKKGAIVTYDIRNYMAKMVEDSRKGEK